MKKKILIVSANYYKVFTTELNRGANSILLKKKYKKDSISVPGEFEIPIIISKNIKKYDAFVALGCVIKGETPHFDFISKATTDALMQLSIVNKKPIGNGIITCLNKKQAIIRSKKKGQEAAKAAIALLKFI